MSVSESDLQPPEDWTDLWKWKTPFHGDLTPGQTINSFDIERQPFTGVPAIAAAILEVDDGERCQPLERDTWVELHPNFGADSDDDIVVDWMAGRPRRPINGWRPGE